ncbi:HASPIN protein kinase [Puccinia triticina 1-1 BBBD Race 1]|uniref:non-specific serine/threonine protein kinase n=2 Tax=Puccinia triticina TaxID=208348 RepID=A0A180G9K3_PUCT1|nr:HASPIN protein kinase [Puccinia triticina 1-1 BBBD Race 1]WAR58323.1 hypothetical protein PtB15_5B557 [Puccinia triticina]
MSMVTGSARRSRFLDLLQSQKLPPGSSPLRHPSPQTPRQLVVPISSRKISCHSPLISHHQITNRSPYVNRAINDGISSLLQICNQTHVLNFTTTVESIEKKAVSNRLSNLRTKTKGKWEKIGEATYSEVFCWSPNQLGVSHESGGNDKKSLESKIVMKIIPIKRLKKSYLKAQVTTTTTTTSVINENRNESSPDEIGNQSLENEFPLETDCLDAEKEIKLAQLLGSKSAEGFIDFKGCFVVSGEYPRTLLKEWDKYRKKFPKLAENPRPGKFAATQLYCCLLFAHAGKDLEASTLNGWQQAASVLEQVTRALSQVEDEYEFEHRDLHWGNLLIHSVEPPPSQLPRPTNTNCKSRVKIAEVDVSELTNSMGGIGLNKPSTAITDPLEPETSGVGVSIIDYGLSRAKIVNNKAGNTYSKVKKGGPKALPVKDHEILWTDPDHDIFGASGGDYQFDCYDLINLTRENKPWSAFNPISNIIWLHYLTKKLIEEKSIARPTFSDTTTTQKDRRKTTTAAAARGKRATANQKLKGKNARYSSHPSTERNGGQEEYENGIDMDEEAKKMERKSRIERECYHLLVVSQRFLHDLIQLKVERIHQRSNRVSGATTGGEHNEDTQKPLKPSTTLLSRSSSRAAHVDADQRPQTKARSMAVPDDVDERAEKLALFRQILRPAAAAAAPHSDPKPQADARLLQDVSLNAAIDTMYTTVNQPFLAQVTDAFKKKKDKEPSFTSFFLDWFTAYKAHALGYLSV